MAQNDRTLQTGVTCDKITVERYRDYLVMRKRALKMELNEIERQLKKPPLNNKIRE